MSIDDITSNAKRNDLEITWRVNRQVAVALFAATAAIWLIGVSGYLALEPPYQVWKQQLLGEAELRRAESTRRILVEQAQAEAEAAALQAQAIETVGEMAQRYPEYRQQQFIAAFGDALQNEGIEKIIFVATEAGVPVVQPAR